VFAEFYKGIIEINLTDEMDDFVVSALTQNRRRGAERPHRTRGRCEHHSSAKAGAIAALAGDGGRLVPGQPHSTKVKDVRAG
jgi:hypothetical protein